MTILLFKWLLVLTFACLIKSDNLINVFAGIVQQTPLNKVAYSNQTRVLFVAGLEGSGHHAFADMMSECERSACSYESKISALSVSYNSTSLATVGLFSGTDGERNDLFISKMLDWMHKLSADAQIKRLHYIGLKDVQLYGGMMSYPNGPVAHKTLDHPDMHILAALAEAARLDVRFIVLLRGAEAVVHSTVDLRSFGSLEPQILIANAEAIYAQLNLISPAFYMCLQYEKLVNVGLDERQRTELISFLHPTVLNMHNLHSMLSKVRKVSHNKSSSREWHARHGARNTSISSIKKPLTNRQYQVHQLQARLDLIGKLCTAQDAWL